jgi:hypothetical protein
MSLLVGILEQMYKYTCWYNKKMYRLYWSNTTCWYTGAVPPVVLVMFFVWFLQVNGAAVCTGAYDVFCMVLQMYGAAGGTGDVFIM